VLVEAVAAAAAQPAVVSVPRTPADCQDSGISIQMSGLEHQEKRVRAHLPSGLVKPKILFFFKTWCCRAFWGCI
jgi:hypothetical protein